MTASTSIDVIGRVRAWLQSTPEDQPGRRPLVFDDPTYRDAVVDLLGAVSYGEISAFERLAEDAKMAPTLEDKVAIATMASAEFGKVAALHARITELGADPFAAMAPFRDAIDLFHEHTAPSDWFESLIKAYVGDGLADDFYREIAAFLDTDTRDLVVASLDDEGHAAFVVDRVRAAIGADPRLGGRLALWGRRLMGEALTQAQRVAAERDALSALLAGGVDRPGLDLAAIGRMFTRITERHAARMEELGLVFLDLVLRRPSTRRGADHQDRGHRDLPDVPPPVDAEVLLLEVEDVDVEPVAEEARRRRRTGWSPTAGCRGRPARPTCRAGR